MIFDCGAVLLFKFMLCLLLLLLYLWLFVAASVTQPNYSTSEHVLKTCYRKIALWPSLCGGISAGVDVDVNRGTRACKNNVKCFYVMLSNDPSGVINSEFPVIYVSVFIGR